MELYAIAVGFVVAMALLLFLLVHLVAKAKRQENLRNMGLPINAQLTFQQAHALLRAFEDTDMRLKKSFPNVTDRQRRVIARDVLRDKGLLPKTRKAAI